MLTLSNQDYNARVNQNYRVDLELYNSRLLKYKLVVLSFKLQVINTKQFGIN